MITVAKLNMLSINKGIIAHGCNAQGVMGAGIAKQIKTKYPTAFELYRQKCLSIPFDYRYQLLGEVVWYASGDLIIANCITQLYYGRDQNRDYVSYQAIEQCFKEINNQALFDEPLPIYFPKIGAGLANGNWDIIAEIIDRVLDDSLSKTLCVV
jgi:O-acetyl-ADP-ribose deacetylase (regulator of RNase III)